MESLPFIPNLPEKYAEYDLLVTHFGIGCFQALHARVPVLLVSPTPYHETLARNAGFVSLGVGFEGKTPLPTPRSLLPTIISASAACAARFGLDEAPRQTLAEFVGQFAGGAARRCPVCGGAAGAVLARFGGRTYRRCPACGTVYLQAFSGPGVRYEGGYFFSDYKAQYGKTYLEDFSHIAALGAGRVKRIQALLPASGEAPRLFDIGCAYGPFLAAAKFRGFSCTGLDPSSEAVDYIQTKLKIKAYTGFFPDLPQEIAVGGFDVVSLWFVLEHFPDPAAALRKAVSLLRPGGVLAFSTPSLTGISARLSLRRFLEKSPSDHVTIWSPKTAGKILEKFGVEVKKIVVTGHHPERFPIVGKFLGDKTSMFYKFFLRWSLRLGLGDTFEFYGVKK